MSKLFYFSFSNTSNNICIAFRYADCSQPSLSSPLGQSLTPPVDTATLVGQPLRPGRRIVDRIASSLKAWPVPAARPAHYRTDCYCAQLAPTAWPANYRPDCFFAWPRAGGPAPAARPAHYRRVERIATAAPDRPLWAARRTDTDFLCAWPATAPHLCSTI